MQITTILDKYQVIILDYKDGSASTRLQVPIENRINNTILTYLDYSGMLHIELFRNIEDATSDEKWTKEDNWITTQLIYRECVNLKWDTDWNATIQQVPCNNRSYHMVITTLSSIKGNCNETIYERITQMYTNLCPSDENYYNENNWILYDYNQIINDIISIITDLMLEVERYDYHVNTLS